ncbi:MAG TPA: hypothetical protein DCO79_10015 [Spirochaeta sp.]|nr:hypothetical protein [Spirochaeta sp.]
MLRRLLPLIILAVSVLPISAVDISLEYAQRLAVQSSPQLRAAREQLELAALKHDLDIRAFLPTVSLSFSSGAQVNTGASDSDSLQFELGLNQPLFDGGRTFIARELTEIELELQAVLFEQQVEELRDGIWQLFYSLLLNREKMELQKELLDISIEQLEIAAAKYKLGKMTELDYLEASIEVQNMELDILDTESSERNLVQDFAAAMGFDPWYFEEVPLNLVGSLNREYEGLNLWTDDYLFYTEKALYDNAELKQQRVELNKADTQLDVIKASWIPTISLDSSFYVQGDGFPMQEPGFTFSIVADFPWSVMPSSVNAGGGARSNQVSGSSGANVDILPSMDFIVNERSAELNLRQTSESVSLGRKTIERQIRTSLEQLEHNRLRINIQRHTQLLSQKRLVILEARSRMGEVQELELLEARIEYYEEEITIRESVLSLMMSEREFEKLIGANFGMLEELSNEIYYKDFK